jgi:hypothetical protein
MEHEWIINGIYVWGHHEIIWHITLCCDQT